MQASHSKTVNNTDFLYINNKIGVIDESEPIDWYMSKEYSDFLSEMRGSTTAEFIEKIISVFRTEIPNLNRLFEALGNKIESHSSTIEVTEMLRDDITSLSAILRNSSNHQTINLIILYTKQDFCLDLSKLKQLNLADATNGEYIYRVTEPSKITSIIYNSRSRLLSILF